MRMWGLDPKHSDKAIHTASSSQSCAGLGKAPAKLCCLAQVPAEQTTDVLRQHSGKLYMGTHRQSTPLNGI